MSVADKGRNNRHKSLTGRFMLVLGMAFIVIYFGLGVAFLCFGSRMPFTMSPTAKHAFGALLLLYAMFRMWRLWNDYKADGRE
jgi:hypothetical protein